MAGEGAKKRLEANNKRLNALRIAVISCTAFYALVRLFVRSSSRTSGHWAGLVATLLAHGLAYLMIWAAARPTYSASGALLDGGGDLAGGGAASAWHDILYVTCAVQVAAALSDRGWWLYATVPAYGAYALWSKVIYPYFVKARRAGGARGGSGGGEMELDERTRARLDRAAGRAERRARKRF